MKKRKLALFFLVLLLLLFVVKATQIYINTYVEIDPEVKDWYEGQNYTIDVLISEMGVITAEREAVNYFSPLLISKCEEIIQTGNITKIQKLMDEADNILLIKVK